MTGAPRTLWLCYALSGAAALALEMLWMRSAALVLGGSAGTTALVLAWYFAGLGLGAAWGRRGSSQPILRYARLEIGAGLGTLWSLLTFAVLTTDGAQASLGGSPLAAPLALAVAILPATIALGATLPAIGQALIEADRLAVRGGWLAAINTVGGALGLVLAGFGMPVAIGVRASYGVVALTSMLAGTLALVVSRRPAGLSSFGGAPVLVPAFPVSVAPRSRVPAPTPASPRALPILLGAATAGALGLGLEVLWARLFAQVLHNSVYSFSAVTLVFVLASALGAGIAAMLGRRADARDLAAGALGLAAASTLGGFWIFLHWTEGLAYMGMRTGLGEYVARIVGLAAITAGPAALASGVVLPALWSADAARRAVRADRAPTEAREERVPTAPREDRAIPPRVAQVLGDLTAANTCGAIVGAIGAAFVVMPAIGLRGGILLATVGYVIAAHVVARPGWRPLPALWVVLLVAVIADPLRAPLVSLVPGVETLRALDEGPAAVTSVVDVRGNLQLRLDNYYVLGGSEAATNERRLGLLPLLLHSDPKRVLFIGLATGITASAAPALGVEDTTVVELVSAVATAAREHFADWNGSLLTRPDVHLVIDDGRRYLQALPATDAGFDVVVSDLFVPWHAGTSSLYAREMYETVARRLAPDGLFCQWLPLYQLTREEFDVIARTFLAVFPHATLWRDDFYPNRPVVGLVGRAHASPIDGEHSTERAAGLPSWSLDPLLSAPGGLAMLYAGDLTILTDDLATTPINTDDWPLIEFLAPRLTRMSQSGDKDWFVGAALADFYDRLLARDPGVAEAFAPASDAVAAARRAGRSMVRYALAELEGDADTALRWQDDVRMKVPEVVAAASADPTHDAGTLRDSLSALRREQEVVRQRLEAMQQHLERLGHGTVPP